MNSHSRRVSEVGWCACVLVLLVPLACAPAGPRLVPVSGTVRLGTAELLRGTVIFHPDARRGNLSRHEPRGKIDPQGQYTMTTAGRLGVAAGAYRVTVPAEKAGAGKNPYERPEWLVPARYIDPSTTPLRVEVVEAPASGAYDLQIELDSAR
jgi:hypothetical protein